MNKPEVVPTDNTPADKVKAAPAAEKWDAEVSREDYFPTMVFTVKLANHAELNDHLLQCIYREQEEDQKGIQKSNFTRLGGWHSKNHLHKKPEFAPIADAVRRAGRHVSKTLGYDPKRPLEIGSMWSIINAPGSFNRAHIHPGAIWSGVYYVYAPSEAGRIEFIDPRTAHIMNDPQFVPDKTRPKECWTKVRFEPKPGRMLLFPSWLYHSVEPNLSMELGRRSDRVIISFNLSQR